MNKKDSSLSILIIPKVDKVKQINISRKSLRIASISLVAICLFLSISFAWKTISYLSFKKGNNTKLQEVALLEEKVSSLKEINKDKDQTAKELEEKKQGLDLKASEVEGKLQQIDNLKKQLEEMANRAN